ncbi:ankyrin repeat domain-containing protein, partial [Wolbachia endosymbiont of Laodelphax striatellus]|uniref:ankyrin repeat domain-containing protein n=1 Tax=Wolbachia endosymbiont of Laodelphax striatellus TaxID=368602 RepID=UPI00155F08BC
MTLVAIHYSSNCHIVGSLGKLGSDFMIEDSNIDTLLLNAAKYGDIEEVTRLIIIENANVNAENEYKKTPLHFAAHNGHKEIVDALLNANANVNAENEDKQTPLHFAVISGKKEVVDALLKIEGININVQDNNKYTSLRLAVENEHSDIAETLVTALLNK